jgi:hypothetical protein
VARIYRITFLGTGGNGELIQPSLHYQTDVPLGGDEPDPNDVAAAVWSHVATQYLNIQPSSSAVHDVVALEEVLAPAIGVAGSHHVGAVGTLTGAASSAPDGCTPVINLHTDTRSRSARGWMFAPPPVFSDKITGNVWSATMKSALDALAALLDDQLTLGTLIVTNLNPVVYSKTRRVRGEDPFTFRVQSASVNPRVHWLKSRMSTP